MAKGISVAGDVLVNRTADGVDLNDIWAEVQDALEVWNKERKSVTDLLSYKTVNVADAVPQSISSDSFEEATEVGLPRAIRPPSDVLRLGYSFKDWDIALRATWKFLREATAEQVRAQVTRVLESDNKLTTGHVMNRLFTPTPRQNEWGHTVYGLWSNDGMVPPPYLGNTFDGTHTHYLTTGYNLFEPPDAESMLSHVKEHGYGVNPGSQLVILINPVDFDASGMSAWRANVEVRAGVKAKYDFIPSALMPAWISDETIHGPVPNADFHDLQVWGSYGGALVIQSNYVPRYYVAVAATNGPNDSRNAVGFREHVNEDYQGLRHIPGHGPYPIQDSIFARGFGTGIRHRGAAVVCQITANANYAAPIIPT